MRKGTVCAGRRVAHVLALAALASFALPARAQDLALGNLGGVPKPEFNGQGYPIGSFRVLPVLAVENTYNDNIFVSSATEEGDYVVSIIPALGIESTWERHFVSLGVFGKIDRYATFSAENSEEYGVAATGRFDLSGGSSVVTELNLGRTTIGRANTENTGRTDPEQLDFLNFDFSYRHEFSRFRLDIDPFVGVRDYVESQDADRDRIQYGGSPRIWYRFSPALSVFVEPGIKVIDYDQKVDDTGVERSSLTLQGFVGARFDFSSLITGKISVGAVHLDFDEPSFDAFTTVGVRGTVSWHVTPLTRVDARVVRRVSPTITAGASSKIQTSGRIGISHALRTDILFSIEGTYFREEFKQLGRDDDNYRIRVGAEYLFNKFVSVGLGYRFRIRDSNVPVEDFTRNVFTLAIELRR